ncbi:MAG: hypothetical protein IT383_01030 [Deltaproteobacteria bacterium]|nr:hypothetical protein [Deltaproteobacteria bacterium]
MTPLEAAEQLNVPVWEVWRGFLCDLWRTPDRTRPKGTLQFEVVATDGARSYFTLTLGAAEASSAGGLAMESTAWIEAPESVVRAMLGGGATSDKLTVTGDRGFVARAFAALKGGPATMSVLGARLAK